MLAVDPVSIAAELDAHGVFLDSFGDQLPQALRSVRQTLLTAVAPVEAEGVLSGG